MKLPRLEKEIRVGLRRTLDVIFEHDIAKYVTPRDVESINRLLATAGQSQRGPTPEHGIRRRSLGLEGKCHDPVFDSCFGFSLGMRHATDSDHVIAVTTIVSQQRKVGSAAAGAFSLAFGLFLVHHFGFVDGLLR
jgi:hypothetical protein